MTPIVSIIMGSTSDLPVVKDALDFLNDNKIPFEVNVLSAHRTPQMVMDFASKAAERGIKVIIAAAGGAAHLPGVIAAYTTLPVIGIPVKSSNSMDGWDSVLSILQMPSGIPVATVALNGSKNAAILAMQILALSNEDYAKAMRDFKHTLAGKIAKANVQLKELDYPFLVK